MNAQPPPLSRDLAATIDWWRDAGVDCDFSDDARVWADAGAPDAATESDAERDREAKAGGSATVTEPSRNSAAAPQRVDLLSDTPPQSLEEFCSFWLEAPGLDTIGQRGRIAPRGPEGAETMVLVIDPEETDRDRLLSGPQGNLLHNMFAAMGVDETAAYVAAALPRHTPMADTVAIARGGMDRVTLHHITLCRPKRVIAFGSGILPLIGHDPTQELSSLREINHADLTIPLLASEGLDSLMSMPRLKARFWRRWIEWSGGK